MQQASTVAPPQVTVFEKLLHVISDNPNKLEMFPLLTDWLFTGHVRIRGLDESVDVCIVTNR